MNKDEAQTLTHAVRALRPEWRADWVMEALAHPDIRFRPFRQMVVAFMAVAADPESKSPRRIHESGDWWKAAAVAMREEPPTPTPDPIRSRPCPEHPDQRMTRCTKCNTGQPLTPEGKARIVAQWRQAHPDQDLPGFMARWEKETPDSAE
ncbi:hypothetical protein ACH0CA_01310 [Kytococcus sedentarius]|uniref:hypothetical protein n=1 Tax=Kytococcus sedentarius TaxID=1276 RepID=UPI00387A1F63